MTDRSVYDNPLVERYASREMAELWGPARKFGTWRRLWLWLAEAQQELGLTAADGRTPRIRPEQLAAMRQHLDDVDFRRAAEWEGKLRHDVMAHIRTFAEACPAAADIIHLGATSCYVTDNTDLMLMREGLSLVRDRLVGVIDALGAFAAAWRDLPCLGYTHFQPAQLTTVGKRACLWCYNLVLDLHEVEQRLSQLRARGAKGTTGTQASFLTLFHGDHDKVRRLDTLVARKMGFVSVYPVTGQTYSRKVDSQILDALSGVCQSAHKLATDLRLLSHEREVEEPFEKEQVGSSAMAYKRNPARSERICGLARYVMALPASAAETAAVQWLERSLDDSVNRRLTLPQAFLGTDAVLRLLLNVVPGLVVNPGVVARQVAEELPYMVTENVLMEAVSRGGNRQELHEKIREHSHAVTAALKGGAASNDLLERLAKDAAFAGVDFAALRDPRGLVGRSAEQVDEFLADVVAPIRTRYPQLLGQRGDVRV